MFSFLKLPATLCLTEAVRGVFLAPTFEMAKNLAATRSLYPRALLPGLRELVPLAQPDFVFEPFVTGRNQTGSTASLPPDYDPVGMRVLQD